MYKHKEHLGGEDADQPTEYKTPERALGGSLQGDFIRLLPPPIAAGEKRQGLGTKVAALGAQ